MPESSGFALWIEELVRRSVAGGIRNNQYGRRNYVIRGQMAVSLSKCLALPVI